MNRLPISVFFILGPSNVRLLTRKHIFEKMQEQNLPDFNKKIEYIENYLLNFDKYSPEQIKQIKHNFSYLKSDLKRRWKASSYKVDKFLSKNHVWLQGTFELPKVVSRSGRPIKTFESSSERTKRRKTEELRGADLEILTRATQSKLYSTGKRDASLVLKEINVSPRRASKIKKAYFKKDDVKTLSTFEALAMIVEAGLTRRQYNIIRATNKKIYPCYSLIQKTKLECYPDVSAYRVTETCAEVKVDSLLEHTNKRLLTYLKDVVSVLKEDEKNNLCLISKWGCDGSQQAQFQQKFVNQADSDKFIFQSSFVPLRLVCGKNNKVLWENPTPSSPRFCRPIRIRFVKESTDITNDEIAYIKQSLTSMPEFLSVTVEETTYKIKQKMLLTMVDGKVCNAATGTTSTQRCYICNETSSDFNKLNKEKIVNPDSLNFGLSILHARIRIFESLLHLAYRLPLQKKRISKKNFQDSEVFAETKLQVQEKFKQEMGLLVDLPKAGFGNSNDGNSSRRFFENPQLSSEITGIDFNLIYRFKVILEAISSGHEINIEKFTKYTADTAKLYVDLYSWCPMTPTMHKILIHGTTVIKHALLPIGHLSEEAAEARNKHFKSYRQNFARKCSREACNLDVINRLLLTSDPLLSASRPKRIKNTKPFLQDTINLLKSAQPHHNDSDPEDTDSSGSESLE